jgi:hypothetical protein
MLFGTRYRFVGDRSADATKALLEAFAEHGEAPGTIAHYVMADGRGGLVIAEQDSIEEAYANLQRYTEWVEFETHPLLKVEDAIPILMSRFA